MVATTTASALSNCKNQMVPIRRISIRYSIIYKTTIPMAKTTKKKTFSFLNLKTDGLHIPMCAHNSASDQIKINSVNRHYKIEEIMKIMPRQNIIIRKLQIGAQWFWAGNGSLRKTTPKEIGIKGIAVMIITATRKGTISHHNITSNKETQLRRGGSLGISSCSSTA